MTSWTPEGRNHEGVLVRYPLVDNDPHFSRVIGSFRSRDYAKLGAATVFGPSFLYFLERVAPNNGARRPSPAYAMRYTLAWGTFLGAWCGFLMVYADASFRWMGVSENRREYERDHAELSKKIEQGEPPYGVPSRGPEASLRAAHHNSMNSQFYLHLVPWFNLVNHPWHGRSMEDYSKPCDWETAFAEANERYPTQLQ